MSYRPRPEFDQPTAESVERSRRTVIWFIPFLVIQQATIIFRYGAEVSDQLVGTVAWGFVSLSLLWMLLGLPFRWLSERDQAMLNDERSRAISGDSACWGIAAAVMIGFAMMIARIWVPLNAGMAIYGLVNGALIVACGRYAWLNRPEPDEDE
jgi:hypothetical protein